MVKKTKVQKMVENIEKDVQEKPNEDKPTKKKRAPTKYNMFCKAYYEGYKKTGGKYKDMLQSQEFKDAWQKAKMKQ